MIASITSTDATANAAVNITGTSSRVMNGNVTKTVARMMPGIAKTIAMSYRISSKATLPPRISAISSTKAAHALTTPPIFFNCRD